MASQHRQGPNGDGGRRHARRTLVLLRPAGMPVPGAAAPWDWDALTREIDDTSSPVRRFPGDRFAAGLRGVQRRYREGTPAIAVPAAERGSANPGTVGTAADWMLRFLVSPRLDLDLAAAGTALAYQASLLPRLTGRRGPWALGPVFASSALVNTDVGPIAAGLLPELKTTVARLSLGVRKVCRLIGYTLLDFDDESQITDLGSGRVTATASAWGTRPPATGLPGCRARDADEAVVRCLPLGRRGARCRYARVLRGGMRARRARRAV